LKVACVAAGVEPKFAYWQGIGSLVEFIVDQNYEYTSSTLLDHYFDPRFEYAARSVPFLIAEKTQTPFKAAGQIFRVDYTALGKVVKEFERRSDLEKKICVAKLLGKLNGTPRNIASAALVSEDLVEAVRLEIQPVTLAMEEVMRDREFTSWEDFYEAVKKQGQDTEAWYIDAVAEQFKCYPGGTYRSKSDDSLLHVKPQPAERVPYYDLRFSEKEHRVLDALLGKRRIELAAVDIDRVEDIRDYIKLLIRREAKRQDVWIEETK